MNAEIVSLHVSRVCYLIAKQELNGCAVARVQMSRLAYDAFLVE